MYANEWGGGESHYGLPFRQWLPQPITVSAVALNSSSGGELKLYLGWIRNTRRLRQINYTQNMNGTHGGVKVRVVLLAEERDFLDPVQRGVILTVSAVRAVRAGLDAVATHPVKVLITSVKLKHKSSLIDVLINITIVRNFWDWKTRLLCGTHLSVADLHGKILDANPSPGPIFFIFTKILPNNRFAPPFLRVGAYPRPPPRPSGNSRILDPPLHSVLTFLTCSTQDSTWHSQACPRRVEFVCGKVKNTFTCLWWGLRFSDNLWTK